VVKKRKVIISDKASNSMKRIIEKLQVNGFLGADKAKDYRIDLVEIKVLDVFLDLEKNVKL